MNQILALLAAMVLACCGKTKEENSAEAKGIRGKDFQQTHRNGFGGCDKLETRQQSTDRNTKGSREARVVKNSTPRGVPNLTKTKINQPKKALPKCYIFSPPCPL